MKTLELMLKISMLAIFACIIITPVSYNVAATIGTIGVLVFFVCFIITFAHYIRYENK